MRRIDINCDMGESFGAFTIRDDAGMRESVTSANIACGFHGGDPLVMYEVMALGDEKGVGVGAHPPFSMFGDLGGAQSLARNPRTSPNPLFTRSAPPGPWPHPSHTGSAT